MEIKVLGSGCPKCKVLYNNVASASRELGLDVNIEKVEEYEKIVAYGVMSTPALVIDGKVVAIGQIKYKKVKELLMNG